MNKNTQEKSIVVVKKDNIFYKIKQLLKNFFASNSKIDTNLNTEEKECIINNSNVFIESIKNVENEEIRLLKLQKQYRCGEIRPEDLTEQEVDSLYDLFKKQIYALRKSNELRRKKS